MEWNERFLDLYDKCLTQYQSGNTDFNSYYTDEDLTFLASIGCKPRELFDFVEDFGDSQTPTRSTALLVAAVRRDYFLVMQKGKLSAKETTSNEISGRQEAFEGIGYLPRIVDKAMIKLKGELDPDLMFGCGGDRRFLRENGNIPMADFLRHCWAAEGNVNEIHAFITSSK